MIPEGKSGDWSVENQYGYLALVHKRVAIMTMEPDALLSLAPAIKKAHGHVVSFGLGLGYVAMEMAKKENVKSVTVVDNSPDVKKLVWEHLDLQGKGSFVLDDAHHFLSTTNRKFDFVEIDCFGLASQRVYQEIALPLRRLAEKLVDRENIVIWQEPGLMIGKKEYETIIRR